MKPEPKQNNCALNVAVMAGLIGLVAILIFRLMVGMSWTGSIFTGLVLAVVIGLVLLWILCRPLPALEDVKPAPSSSDSASSSKTASSGAGVAAAGGVATGTAAAASATTASTTSASTPTAAGIADIPAEPAAAKPAAKAEAKPAAKAAAKPAEKAKPAAKAEAKPKPAAKKAAAKAPAKKAPAKAKARPDGEPEMLKAARAGGADDLKLISGVGPKLEGTLNSLGVYHFDQVASWGVKDIAWVDERLTFKGRIERDDWVSQAKTLAAGGTTEFSERKKKK